MSALAGVGLKDPLPRPGPNFSVHAFTAKVAGPIHPARLVETAVVGRAGIRTFLAIPSPITIRVDPHFSVTDGKSGRWDGSSMHDIGGTDGDYVLQRCQRSFPAGCADCVANNPETDIIPLRVRIHVGTICRPTVHRKAAPTSTSLAAGRTGRRT